MTETSPKQHRDITETRPRQGQDTTETRPRHDRDTTETWPGHHRDNTKATPRHHQKKTETRPRHDRDMTETSPKQHQDITGTRPRHPGWIFFRCMRGARPPYPCKTPSLSLLGKYHSGPKWVITDKQKFGFGSCLKSWIQHGCIFQVQDAVLF